MTIDLTARADRFAPLRHAVSDRIGYAQWLSRRLSRAQIRLQAATGRRYAPRNWTR